MCVASYLVYPPVFFFFYLCCRWHCLRSAEERRKKKWSGRYFFYRKVTKPCQWLVQVDYWKKLKVRVLPFSGLDRQCLDRTELYNKEERVEENEDDLGG